MNSVSSLKPSSYFNTALLGSKQADFKAVDRRCNQEIDQLMEKLMPKVMFELKGLTNIEILQAAEEAKIAIANTFAQIDNLLLDLEKAATHPNELKHVQLVKDELTEIHNLFQKSNNNLLKLQQLAHEVEFLSKEGSTQNALPVTAKDKVINPMQFLNIPKLESSDLKRVQNTHQIPNYGIFIITSALIAYLIYNNYEQMRLSELPKMASSAMSSLQRYSWKLFLTVDQKLLSCPKAYSLEDSVDHLGIEACIMNAKKQTASAFMSCFGIRDLSETPKKMKHQLTQIHPDKNNKFSLDKFSKLANDEDQKLLSCSKAYYFEDSVDHLGIEACIMNAKKQTASAFMSCFGISNLSEMRKKMKHLLTKIHPDKNIKFSLDEFSRLANLYEFLKKNKKLDLDITDINNCENLKDKIVEEGIKRWASQQQKMSDYSIEKLGKKGTFSSSRCDTSDFGSLQLSEIKQIVCSERNNICFCVTQNLGLRKKPNF